MVLQILNQKSTLATDSQHASARILWTSLNFDGSNLHWTFQGANYFLAILVIYHLDAWLTAKKIDDVDETWGG